MINEKLVNQTKVKHISIVKQYSFAKIQLMNYFANVGKLKSLQHIQESVNKSTEHINEMFLEKIKKLRLKLESIDSKIINYT